MSPIRKEKLLIAGAGPSGLMAAITAASHGASPLLLEGGSEAGRKLLLTGGGRANLGNLYADDFERDHYYGRARFLRPAFRAFSPADWKEWLEERHFPVKVEEEGRLFPESGGSIALRNFLLAQYQSLGGRILYHQKILDLRRSENTYILRTATELFSSPRLILATGGASFPETGSDASVLSLLKKAGLSVLPLRPALTSIQIPDFPFAHLTGISAEARLCLLSPEAGARGAKQSFSGSVLLTEKGLSGMPAQNLSRWLSPDKETEILLSFLSLPFGQWFQLIQGQLREYPRKRLRNFSLPGLARRLSMELVRLAGLDFDRELMSLTEAEWQKLARVSSDLRFSACSGGIKTAFLSRGGVSLQEINPRTFECKRFPGLYITGEMLDIDGECGGYNLQAAFSAAYLAGDCACRAGISRTEPCEK